MNAITLIELSKTYPGGKGPLIRSISIYLPVKCSDFSAPMVPEKPQP